MLFAQITNDQIANGGIILGGVYLITKFFELSNHWMERKDRKAFREQVIAQAEVLRNVHTSQEKIRNDINTISVNLAVAIDRQVTKEHAHSICKLPTIAVKPSKQ